MNASRKLPAATILVVLGVSLMPVGGFWVGALLVACGFVGLLIAYRQRGGSPRRRMRPDQEWTRKQAVLRELGVSLSGPLGVLIASALRGDLSWTGATAFLGIGAVIFPLVLLSMWGRVRPRQRSQ